MRKVLKEQSGYFLKNKWFVLMLCISAAAGYAYVLTHGTCGIDDISIDIYFEKGLGVAIGRWPYYLINKVIPVAEYTPFIGDLITVLVLMAAAAAWCMLLRMLMPWEVSIWAYIAFAALFMDYSMNADVFVFYLQNGLGWVHLLSVLSLIAFLYLYRNQVKLGKQILIRGSIIAMLLFAISFYESAANIFLTGIMLVMLIDLFVKKKESPFRGKGFVLAILFAGRYLIYAMVARRVMRSVLMSVFSIPAYTFYRSASSIEWIIKGGIGNIWNNIMDLLAQIYCDYFALAVTYYPILLFVICTIIFLGALAYYCWMRKDGLLLFTGLGAYASMFVLCVIEGNTMAYRACQIFTIFVAMVFFGMVIVLEKSQKWTRICGGGALIFAMLYSVYDINQWFALDYEKTEYEMKVIDQIAAELNSGKYNVADKPLVVVGDFELPEEIYDKYCMKDTDFGWAIVKSAAEAAGRDAEDKYCYGQNDSSMIDWSVHAFAMHYGYNVPIRQFFEYRGHQFNWADAETVKQVFDAYYPLDWDYYSYTYIENYQENYGGAAEYPEAGYIEEAEDCIIIRL